MTRHAKRLNERLNAFYQRWGAVVQLITGAVLLGLALFVTFVAVSLYSYRSYGDQLVHASCERSREFSPAIADFYEQQHVLSAKALADYRRTIPPHC